MKRYLLITAILLFASAQISAINAQTCVKGDCRKGHGTMTWTTGEKYEGEWKKGTMDGKGTMTWPDGKKYSGEWKNGLMQGKGTMQWPDGTRYTGEFKKQKMEGKGVMTWKTGDKYDGQWKNDTMDGKGTMKYARGTTVKGDWKDGKYVEKAASSAGLNVAGKWRVFNKMNPDNTDNFPDHTADYTFNADGTGVFHRLYPGESGIADFNITWTLSGNILKITVITNPGSTEKDGNPVYTYTWDAAKKRFYDEEQSGPFDYMIHMSILQK